MLPAGRWNKPVLVLVALSSALLVLERMIGETILGNVILLLMAMGAASLATLVALIDLAIRRSTRSIAGLLGSVAPIAYVVVRFVLDNVPMGYGP